MVNQLFYSPDTRIKIEQELCKLSNEPNPFRTGHWSKWGQNRETAETISEMMERWNETLENSELVKYLFGFYKSELLSEITNSSNKKLCIEEQIPLYTKRKLDDNESPTSCSVGYKNKGYRWFELGKNFSLKDFITYHPETISDQIYRRPDCIVYHSFISIETLAEHAPLNEVNFLYACEGYAAAKYVAFLKNELEELNKTIANNIGKITMQTNLSEEQLKKLRNELIISGYIKEIKENDFIYFFSGKPLKIMEKIKWQKAISVGDYLLRKVCLGFSYPVVNNCIETKNHEKFDSNKRTKKSGYNEIDVLLELIKA